MTTSYNRIAGESVERLAALSDGIFAVAMTLLVPEACFAWHGLSCAPTDRVSDELSDALHFWNGQQAQLNRLARADRHLTWINMAFLFAVSIMPFSTRLLAEFIGFRTALLCYWGNVLLLGLVLYLTWRYARRARLLKQDTPEQVSNAIERRILVAQLLLSRF